MPKIESIRPGDTLAATFGSYPLAELLLGILRGNLTGRLDVFLHPESRNHLHFRDGVPVVVNLPDGSVSLVQVLVQDGRLPQQKGMELLRMAESSGKSEADVMRKRRLFPQVVLHQAEVRWARAQLVKLFDAGPVEFRFTEGAKPPEGALTILQPLPVVYEGLSTARDQAVVEHFVSHHGESRFTLSATYPRDVDPFEWGTDVEAAIQRLRQPSAMEDLVDAGLAPDRASVVLTALHLADMVELREQGPRRPSSPRPAPAAAQPSPLPIPSSVPAPEIRDGSGLMIHRRPGVDAAPARASTSAPPRPAAEAMVPSRSSISSPPRPSADATAPLREAAPLRIAADVTAPLRSAVPSASASDADSSSRSSAQAAADAASPSRDSGRASADATVPLRGSGRAAADTASPSRSAARGAADTTSPSRSAARAAADTASPSRSAARGAADTASPSRSAARGAADTASPSRSAARGEADTASPSRGAARGAADTASPSRSAGRGAADTTSPSRAPAGPPPSTVGGNAHDREYVVVRDRLTSYFGQNYYQILRVTPESDPNQLDRAYRFLVRRFEDEMDRPGTAPLIDIIHEAYEVLKDPEASKRYAAIVERADTHDWIERERRALEAEPKVDRAVRAMAVGRTGEATFLLSWAERLDPSRTDLGAYFGVLDVIRAPDGQRAADARALRSILQEQLGQRPYDWRIKLCMALVLAEDGDPWGANRLLEHAPDRSHPMALRVSALLDSP